MRKILSATISVNGMIGDAQWRSPPRWTIREMIVVLESAAIRSVDAYSNCSPVVGGEGEASFSSGVDYEGQFLALVFRA